MVGIDESQKRYHPGRAGPVHNLYKVILEFVMVLSWSYFFIRIFILACNRSVAALKLSTSLIKRLISALAGEA